MKSYFKNVLIHAVVWFVAFGFWSIMRQFGQELIDEPKLDLGEFALIYMTLAICAGFVFGSLDSVWTNYQNRRTPFGKAVLQRAVVYTLVFIMLTVLGIIAFSFFDETSLTLNKRFEFLISKEMVLLLVYCFIVVFVIHFVKELDRKFGPGNLLKMLLGSFYRPKEEDRIFMFLDLTSSTAIAENLGHIKYSQLIQDCFADLNVVSGFQAEVYQYVGDEVVLTWPLHKLSTEANCLAAFYAFKDRINERSDYYKKTFGIVPHFKAGINVGKVVVAEVGAQKREIAYHGDTINTAARIQSECSVLGEELLISKALVNLLASQTSYAFHAKGKIQLKGKTTSTEIFSVTR